MEELDDKRNEAIKYVEDVWEELLFEYNNAEDTIHSMALHDAIWHASTVILPALEVQAVIDSRNVIYVSTGTAGYVDYLTIDPSMLIGMKLPIRCWIHTHPFGAAYFSGTDIRTISIWQTMMDSAYVLGSKMSTKGHYGFWSSKRKNQLEIYVNNEPREVQTWGGRGMTDTDKYEDEKEYECYECGREWTRNNGRGCPYGDPTCFLCEKHDHSDCDEGEEE